MNRRTAAMSAMLTAALAMTAVTAPACAQSTPLSAAVPAAYYIAEFEVTNAEGIKPYSAKVESTFAPYGGRYIVRRGTIDSLEGTPPKPIVVIAFPSGERARAWYDSAAYRAIRPIRQASATSRVFIVEGIPAPAN